MPMSAHQGETRLVDQLKNGQDSALEQVIACLGPWILFKLRQKYPILAEEDREDLLVDAVAALWDHRQDYDPSRARLSTFLWTIADNRAKDLLKLGWYRARLLEISLDAAERPDSANGAWLGVSTVQASNLEKQEVTGSRSPRLEFLKTLLLNLSAADRRIMLKWAVHREGNWAQELADELRISAGTIRVKRHRIAQQLIQAMGGAGFAVANIQGASRPAPSGT